MGEEKKPAKAEGAIHLEIKGTVTTGIAAIGGETTGVLITTKDGFRCELEGKVDESLNKKTAMVTGSFAVRAGVEVRNRAILKVDTIKAAEEKPDEQFVKVKMTGTVQTGVLAPGGATTGVTITGAGVTWELDAAKDKTRDLNGKLAEVTGTIEVKKSNTGRQPRTIIKVTDIKAVEEKNEK
jgi:hypothetical protein